MHHPIILAVALLSLSATGCKKSHQSTGLRIPDETNSAGDCSAAVVDRAVCDVAAGGSCEDSAGDVCICVAVEDGSTALVRCEPAEGTCPEEGTTCLSGTTRTCADGTECTCDASSAADGGPVRTWDCSPATTDCTCANPNDRCTNGACSIASGPSCAVDGCPSGYSCVGTGDVRLPEGGCLCTDLELCGAICRTDGDCGSVLPTCDAFIRRCDYPTFCMDASMCPSGQLCSAVRGFAGCIAPGEAALGETCTDPSDCLSGVCYCPTGICGADSDAGVCVAACAANAECDVDQFCTEVRSLGDSLFGCLHGAGGGCPPDSSEDHYGCVSRCLSNADCRDGECWLASGAPAACASYGGSHCGATEFYSGVYCGIATSCRRDNDCPNGYQCVTDTYGPGGSGYCGRERPDADAGRRDIRLDASIDAGADGG